MSPADFQKKNENRLWVRLFGDGDTNLKPQISQGTIMRASSHKTIFDKGYMPNWTKKHFTVSMAMPPRNGTMRRIYKLVDFNDEDVKGSWYPEELQEILDNQYRIEKVLQRRTLPNGTKEIFVRWKGWPEKYNSWITETDKYDVVAEWWVPGVASKQCERQFKKQTQPIWDGTCKATGSTWRMGCDLNKHLVST